VSMELKVSFRLFVFFAFLFLLLAGAPQAWAGAAATTTTLAISSGGSSVTTVASGSVVTLTAAVNAGSTSVKTGQVKFCDASAAYCTDIHILGTAQLTNAGKAIFKFRPGIGNHSYKAVFLGTNTDAGSVSGASALDVTGTIGPLASTTAISQTGSWGNYTLTATVTETGNTAAPSMTVSFKDTSNGNSILDTAPLGAGVAGVLWASSKGPTTPTNSPQAVAVGDFNGDGIPDLAVSAGGPSQPLEIFLGNANGTYTAVPGPSIFTYSFGPIVVADFNGDGKQDMAVLNANSNVVTILLGNGDGTFNIAPSSPSIGTNAVQIAVGDFNGDGIPDLAVTTGSSLDILLGNGDGTFNATPSSPMVSSAPFSIAVGDFNGDGKLDLAVSDAYSDSISILLGNGDGTFATTTTLRSGSNGSPIVTADFTGDGKLDLAVRATGAAGTGDSATILSGNGDGTFNVPSFAQAATYGSISSVQVGDFNADGIPDLALMDGNNGTFTVLLGNGGGSFTATTSNVGGGTGLQLLSAVADLNGDGRPDLVVANFGSDIVSIYLTEPTETATATASISLPVVGQHLVEASYGGDGNYNPSISGTIPLWGVPPATTTTLTITSGGTAVTSVAPDTVVLLTATVKAGASVLTAGQVNFCDASVKECTDVHILGTAALTSGGTAAFKFVPGPGVHSYKAEFVQNGYGLTSSSAALALTVGPAPKPVYSDTTTITSSGSPGAYSLTATVLGIGGPASPTGNVSFLDTSFGNTSLASVALGPGTAGLGWLISQTATMSDSTISEVTGDFNGDGIPDLALLTSNSIYDGPFFVTVLFGKGDGTFTTGPTTQLTGVQEYPIMVGGDFNGDGKIDLAILSWSTTSNTSFVTTILGNGDGTFGAAQSSTAYNQGLAGGDGVPGQMVAADFNGDGKLDLAVVGDYETLGGITILLGNGDGTFKAAGPNVYPSAGFGQIATGDFNGDGIPDLVATNYFEDGSNPIVFLGKGDGTFTAVPMSLTLDYFPTSIVVGDFNGDGVLDVGFSDLKGVEIALGNGDGTFKETAASPIAIPNELTGLALGDFNHDGKLDIAGIDDNNGFAGIVLLTGAGDGTFEVIATPVSTVQNSITPAAIIAADFNSDGVPDLAMLSKNSTTATILLTEPTQTATVTVNGIAPVGAATHNVDASYAGDTNYAASVSTTTALTAGVAAPVIRPASGTFKSAQPITITDATPGATIYYEAQYNQPPGLIFGNWVQYTGPIPMEGSGTLTIIAYATATGYQQSVNASATYAVNFPPAPMPVLSLASGDYPGTQTLTIADSAPGAQIYYTTNGTYPSNFSTLYSGPITISASEIVAAVAIAPGYSFSGYATGQYYISSSLTRFIYTIAGSYTWGYSGDGGPATFAELNGGALRGVAVDGSGNVYMTDYNSNVVRKIAASTGIITTIAGTGVAGHTGDSGPAASAELWGPSSLAVDATGDLFIGETGDNVVRRIDAVTGTITTFAGNATGTGSIGGPATSFPLYGIVGIACDHFGNLYIAESEDVVEVSAGTGNISEIAGLTTGAGFGILNGIAVDAVQNIYVSDSAYSVVRKINPMGAVSVFAGSLYGASGGDGGPATSAGLYFPAGLAADGAGNIYIADDFDLAIREVNTSGIINTIGGILHDSISIGGDGSPAADVGIYYPQVIAADSAGDVYFGDQDTSRIRKITAPVAPPTSAAASPVFSLTAGTYSAAQTLTMTNATPGAEIYVSLNGSAPTTAGQGYHGPIQITGSVTVQAVAVAPGYLTSAPASATYIISTPPTALISTVAGNGKYGFLAGGGPANNTSIGQPQAVAFDGSDNLYIADIANSVVWMVSASTGNISVVAGTGTSGNGAVGGQATETALSRPSGVAIDKSGDIFIADTDNGIIRKVAAQTGVITTIAGPGVSSTLGDGGPATSAYIGIADGIAFDKAGNLYIADTGTSRIRMIAANTGIISTVAGGGTAGQLGDGGLATAAYIWSPEDIALDGANNLYILDAGNERIRNVNASTGIITTIAGNGTFGATGDGGLATAAEINVQQGIAVDGSGNVYFSNFQDTIRRVDAVTQIVTTIAGDGYWGYGGDGGAATMAELFDPAGLAFDAVGSLYISDSANDAVRKVKFAGPAVAPTVTLTPSASSITTAQSSTVTVSVSGASGNPTPTGSVTLTSGSYTSAPATLSGGSATIDVPAGSLATGSDTLTATYTPDSNSTSLYSTASGTASLTVNPAPSFTLSPSTGALSVVQGSNNNDTITISGANGFSGSVTLSATGLPSGVTASFGTNPATGSSVLTLTATGSSVVGGPVTVTITGTSGSLTASITLALTVTAGPTFVVGGSSSSLSIEPGATTGNTVSITVTPSNGFTGTVNLTCAVTPAAASDPPTCSLTPSSLTITGTGAQSSTLTIFSAPATNSRKELKKLLWPSAGTALACLMLIGIPRRKRNWLTMVCLLVLIASFGAIGCGGGGNSGGGGGGGGGGGNTGTTPGTYTVTVTGTSGTLTGTVGTVTLTVQ